MTKKNKLHKNGFFGNIWSVIKRFVQKHKTTLKVVVMLALSAFFILSAAVLVWISTFKVPSIESVQERIVRNRPKYTTGPGKFFYMTPAAVSGGARSDRKYIQIYQKRHHRHRRQKFLPASRYRAFVYAAGIF